MSDVQSRLFRYKTTTVDGGEHGTFYVRLLSGEELQIYIDKLGLDPLPKANDLYSCLVSMAIAKDNNGEREFTDDQLDKVKKIPAPLLLQLYNASHRWNFPTIEDAKKN